MPQTRRDRERQMREREIVEAAEKLFSKNGFEGTSMDDIAKASEFTKRTVYQYFDSKEELFYAVTLRGMERLLSYVREAGNPEGTGADNIRSVQKAAFRCTQEYPDVFRLMSYIQYLPASEESSPRRQAVVSLNRELYLEFNRALSKGQRDGSILPQFSTTKEAFAAFFVVTGSMARLYEVGDTYAAQLGISLEEMAGLVIDLNMRLFQPSAVQLPTADVTGGNVDDHKR